MERFDGEWYQPARIVEGEMTGILLILLVAGAAFVGVASVGTRMYRRRKDARRRARRAERYQKMVENWNAALERRPAD